MNTQSRIPKLDSANFDGALLWFSQMQMRELSFHPDEDPAEIVRIGSWERIFSDTEVSELRFVMDELFNSLGDRVYEAAYPVAMKAFGQYLDA